MQSSGNARISAIMSHGTKLRVPQNHERVKQSIRDPQRSTSAPRGPAGVSSNLRPQSITRASQLVPDQLMSNNTLIWYIGRLLLLEDSPTSEERLQHNITAVYYDLSARNPAIDYVEIGDVEKAVYRFLKTDESKRISLRKQALPLHSAETGSFRHGLRWRYGHPQ